MLASASRFPSHTQWWDDCGDVLVGPEVNAQNNELESHRSPTPSAPRLLTKFSEAPISHINLLFIILLRQFSVLTLTSTSREVSHRTGR